MPVQFNQLLKWGFNLFNGNSWTELFGGLGQLFSRLIYYLIVCAVGKIADICQLIFRKFAGLSDGLMVGNKVVEGDLVYYLFQHPIVKNLLISLALLAAFILIIATFVGTIKTEFAKDGNNNKRKVIKNAFRGLANFVLVPVICMFGIFIGNALLRAIDGATGGGSGSLASQMFLVGGYNANRARMSENNGADRDNNPYELGSFGDVLTGQSDGGAESGYGNFGIFLDDGGNSLTGRRAADKIDAFFENGAIITKAQMENMSPIQHTLKFSALSTYYGGALADNVKVDYKDIDYGGSNDYASRSESITNDNGEVLIPYTAEITFSVYNAGLVYYYYDLTLGTFDYFISTIAMLFCAYTLLVTVLGLIKRLFMLTTLFVISAPVCAIYPIDEGKALERWRTEFIKETLSAYSTVVVMNIFLSLLPIIKEITVFANNGDLGILGNIPMIKGFANYLARVLIVVAGLLFFKDASKTIASIIGANDAAGAGASASSGFAKRAGAGLAIGAGAVVGAARLAGKGIGAIDRSIQMRKDAKGLAKEKALNEGEGNGGEDSKATEPGAVGAEQHSMNGAPAGGDTGGAACGGDASGAAGAPSSVGAESNSMNGAGSGAGGGLSVEQKAAAKAKDKYERYDKASKSLFNSIENEKYKEDLDDKLKGHTKFGRGMIKAGGFLRGLHNSNLIRGFRNGVGGLFSAIAGIATGKGKIGDAFNWTKGSANARKKLEEYKKDLKDAKSGKKSAEQHAEEVAEQRAMEQARIQEQRAMEQLKLQEQRELARNVKENSLLIKIKDKQDAIERLQREIEDAKRKRDEIGGLSGYLKTEQTITSAQDSIAKNQEELKRLVEELEKLNKKD
ncbi:MAG: hypothetical protein IKR12_01480 [Clostridia bacterium]|nr:hypothetical protein [Clostridia bacterium]